MPTVVRPVRSVRSAVVGAAAAALATISLAGPARAAIIATYWFTGSDPAGDALVPTAPHVTFSAVTRHGLNAVSLADEFASSDYTQSPTIDPTDSYIEFTVTAAAGYKLQLDSLDFYFTRVDQNSQRTGPRNGSVRASFESFADGSGTGDEFSPATTEQHTTWDFTNWTSPDAGSATFRIYGWNSTGVLSNNMQLVIDDISVHGSVVANPEPSTVVALLPLVALRRRARRVGGRR